jgi:hypothetical protein
MMTHQIDTQHLSLGILSKPDEELKDALLDLLILEDHHLPQLHPIARAVVIKAGLLPGASLDKEILDEALKTIFLTANVGTCETDGEAIEDEEPEYSTYNVRQQGQASMQILLSDIADIFEDHELELVFSFEMSGATVDGDALDIGTIESICLSTINFSTSEQIANEKLNDKDWLGSLFMESTSRSCTDPGHIYLCGDVDIFLAEARLSTDNETTVFPVRPPLAIASAWYYQGELQTLGIANEIKDAVNSKQQVFWPRLLPDLVNALIGDIALHYKHAIQREKNEEEKAWLKDLQFEAEELIRDHENQDLLLDIQDILDEFIVAKPLPLRPTITIDSEGRLPEEFDFQTDIGLPRLRSIIYSLRNALQATQQLINE